MWILVDPTSGHQTLQASMAAAHNASPMERQTLTAEDGFEIVEGDKSAKAGAGAIVVDEVY